MEAASIGYVLRINPLDFLKASSVEADILRACTDVVIDIKTPKGGQG